MVIARGILEPLIDGLTCRPGRFDVLFLELVDLENPSRERWWRDSLTLLRRSLQEDIASVVQVAEHRYEELVWCEIANLLNAGELKAGMPSPAVWWAKNSPLMFVTKWFEDSRRIDLALRFAQDWGLGWADDM